MNFLYNGLNKSNIFFILIFTLGIGQSYACSCNFPTIEWSVNVTPIIFKGKVIGIEKIPLSEVFVLDNVTDLESRLTRDKLEWFTKREMLYRVQFEECTFFKGETDKKNITIYTTISGASCGYHFLEEETYVVYSDYNNFFSNIMSLYDLPDIKPQENLSWTNLCMRNTTDVVEEEREIKNQIDIENSFFRRTFRDFEKSLRKAMTH